MKKEFDYQGRVFSGIGAVVLLILLIGVSIASGFHNVPVCVVLSIVTSLYAISCHSLTIVEPNEAFVLLLFGKYVGTLKANGFFWINPFLTKRKVSLRAINLNAEPIKVNDKQGNPVMIGLVLVWKIADTYRAVFEIQGNQVQLPSFVAIQADAALRRIAGLFAYDTLDSQSEEITLRSGGDEIIKILEAELSERLAMAGIEIIEARINYLAYAQEIAGAMLRRQQAEAIIAAREKIVEGAVTMVELALNRLEERQIVRLDEEKKAAMVGNLLVVLCADESAQPVINTGTLNH